jgi:hypothetical protein
VIAAVARQVWADDAARANAVEQARAGFALEVEVA